MDQNIWLPLDLKPLSEPFTVCDIHWVDYTIKTVYEQYVVVLLSRNIEDFYKTNNASHLWQRF